MKFYCFSLIVAAIAPLAVVANRNIRGSKLDTNGEINDFLDYFRILGVGSMTDKGDVEGDDDVWMGDDKTPDDYYKDTKVGKSMKSKREKSEKKSKEKLEKSEKGKSGKGKSGTGKSGKKEKVKHLYYCRDLSMYLSFFQILP
jgi:hypothetical protein